MLEHRWQTLLGLSASLACGWPVAAQDISGRVVVYGRVEDATSRAPIVGAEVLSLDSTVVVLTDSLGAFVIALPAGEPIALYAAQLGYLTQRLDLDPIARSRLVVLRLEPSPLEIEGLTVEAEAALTRLMRGIDGRARASGSAVTSLDRPRLERYGSAATVLDVIRARAGRITECWEDPNELCTWSRWVTFRAAYPQVSVQVCVDELRSLSPVNELSNLSIESVARLEIFGRSTVRVYTLDWMLNRARSGYTTVYPEWMGC